jgi:hypothetical protein
VAEGPRPPLSGHLQAHLYGALAHGLAAEGGIAVLLPQAQQLRRAGAARVLDRRVVGSLLLEAHDVVNQALKHLCCLVPLHAGPGNHHHPGGADHSKAGMLSGLRGPNMGLYIF